MMQAERLKYLIEYLIYENPQYNDIVIPKNEKDQKHLFRSLVNIRPALPVSEVFLRIQNEYLSEENKLRGITDIADLEPTKNAGLYLWRGDITTLRTDAIVNAANSGMTGCWQPCHSCIDNCIHTFAGIQLRAVCDEIMRKQGYEEPTGQAKITPAFNLPCKFVLHTVGPIIHGELTKRDCELLASSTGVFHFPQDKAAEIAISTVCEWRKLNNSSMQVIFNVFSEKDEEIYRSLLYD